MKINIRYILIISGIFIFSLIGHFWIGNYYKKPKFKIFLTLITTITSIMFSTAIILQVNTYNKVHSDEEISQYNNLSKLFLDDFIEIFMKYPEMNYYYKDLMGIKMIDNNTKRNIYLENQISMLFFSKLGKFAIVIQSTDDETLTKKIDNWIGHVAATFLKSPTLRQYWTNEYKPKLSGPASVKYMKEHFNL